MDADDVALLMINCPEFRTEEVFDYFESLEPSAKDVAFLMTECPWFVTEEVFDYFKTLDGKLS